MPRPDSAVKSCASTLLGRRPAAIAFDTGWSEWRASTPRRAAAAKPLTIVAGVEITSAQGQAMTSSTSAL